MKFERRPDKKLATYDHPNPVFHVQWRSVKGLIEVNPRAPQNVIIFYKRWSHLGDRFAQNHEQECYFVAQAVRKALDLPPDTTFSYTGI
jgi:hypothetical protein